MSEPKRRGPAPGQHTTHDIDGWSWNNDLLESKIPEPDANGCQIWQGAKSPGGALFGAKKNGNKPQMTQVRRLIWRRLHPDTSIENLDIALTCGNPQCVASEHFTLVERGVTPRVYRKRKIKDEYQRRG